MAGNVKGITIEIGGDTRGLNKSLKSVDNELRVTQKELREVEAALKLDPENIELVAQKQKLLTKQIDLTADKVEALKDAQKRCNNEMKSGTQVNQEMYRKLTREITFAEKSLKDLNSEADDFGKKAESNKKESDGLSGSFGGLKGKAGAVVTTLGVAAGVVTAVGTAMKQAADETREYREDMNRLDTAFKSAGQTTETARKTYKDFYVILGESDRSVEAVNHLAKFVKTEKEFAQWGDICAGVSATFGDSLPIEGLTEAANETAKTGKVTGVLADALNWAGISEDEFNEKLEGLNSEQERSQLITSTLSATYMEASNTFKTMNADVIANRDSAQRLTDIYAAFGGVVEPAITWGQNLLADLGEGALKTFGVIKDESALLTEEIHRMSEAQQESTAVIEEKTVHQLAEIETAKLLYDELVKLTDETGKVKDKDKERADFIIGELNEALGLEITRNGDVITSLGEVGQSIDQVIAKKQAQILMQGQEEEYAEAIKNVTQAQKDRDAALQALIEKQQVLQDLHAGNERLSVEEARAAFNLRNEIAGLQAEYDKAEATYSNYQNTIETQSQATKAAMEGDVEGVIRILDGQNDAIQNATAVATENADLQKQKLGEAVWDAAVSLQGALQTYEGNMSETNKKALENTIAQYNDAKGKFEAAGGTMIDGIIVGLDGKTHTLTQKMKSIMDQALWAALTRIDSHSPSRVYRDKVGKMMVEGIEVGIIEEGVQLEKEMDKLLKNLDLQRDTGAISEAEYYKKLEEYRDEYFTKGTEGWWEYTQKIIDFENDQLEEQKKVLDKSKEEALKTFEDIAKGVEKNVQAVESSRDKFADKLADFGTSSLFETTTDIIRGGAKDGSDIKITRTNLTSLSDNIQKLRDYTTALKAVKAKGVPKGFFDMLRDMGVEEGTAFANAILATPDNELNAYLDDWTYIQEASKNTADEFFGDDFAAEKEAAMQGMNNWMEGLPEDWKENGVLSAQSFGEGFAEEFENIKGSIQSLFADLFADDDVPTFTAIAQGESVGSMINNTRNVSYTNNFYGNNTSPSDIDRALRKNEQQATLL